MPVVRNKLNQRLVINLQSDKDIDILAKSSANISEKDLESRHLQTLLSRGDIIVIRDETDGKKEKNTEKEEGRAKRTVTAKRGK